MPKLVCSKSGTVTVVRQPIYDALIKKFGSEEELKQKYVCRKFRKQNVETKKEVIKDTAATAEEVFDEMKKEKGEE